MPVLAKKRTSLSREINFGFQPETDHLTPRRPAEDQAADPRPTIKFRFRGERGFLLGLNIEPIADSAGLRADYS